MSANHPAAVRQPRPLASPLYSALFLCFAAFSVLRVALNNRVVDMVMDYTGDGGPIVAKIHPATWGLLVVTAIVALSYRVVLTAWERDVVRAILVVSAIAAVFVVIGSGLRHTSSTGYLVDDYVTLIVVVAFFAFPPSWRRQLGFVLFAYLVANALVGIPEFATRTHLVPYAETEAAFRPLGLTSHPLAFGEWCAFGMCLACGFTQLGRLRGPLVLLFATSLVLSGARIATITGFLSLLICFIAKVGADADPQRRRRLRLLITLSMAIVVPILLAALLAVGAFTRFQGGLADANGMSRIDVYGVLGLLPWSEVLFGGDIDQVRKLIHDTYGYDSIESSLLVLIVQFGLAGACVFLSALGRLVQVLCRQADISVVLALVSFFLVSLSNNALTVKSPDIFFFIAMLGIAFHPGRDAGREPTS